jgi:hypothetical protein
MSEEQENPTEESGHKPFTDKGVNKVLAILFVLAIYAVIFLKILFIS